jgi:FlaG/FlaF family flagellin (archaellin)
MYGDRMEGNEDGASELLDETLIIAMGLVLAVVVGMMVFGLLPMVEKSAYMIPKFGVGSLSGTTFITMDHRSGDPVDFSAQPESKHSAVLYVDTQGGSFTAVPVTGLSLFNPGDTLYVYYTGSGFVLTNTLAGASFVSLPAGTITVRLVDATSGTVIARDELILAQSTSPTATATATGTTTTTTTPTTTATTTTVTATISATTSTTATATVTATTSATVTATTSATTTTTHVTATPVPTQTCCPPGWYVNGKCACDATAKARGCC